MHIKQVLNWVVPAGIHEAKIVDARVIGNQGNEQLRLIFHVTSLKQPGQKYQAKRCYDETGSKQLLEDLTSLLGSSIGYVVDDDGKILEEGLDLLLGKRVRIEVVHVRNDRFANPYCRVQNLFKPLHAA